MGEYIANATQRKALEGFVHPAVFENTGSEFGYSGFGTIFTAKFRGSYYAITAKHIISEPWQTGDLRILLRGHDHTVPFDRESIFPNDDQMINDLAIFRVDTGRLKSLPPPNLQFINLDSFCLPDYKKLEDHLFMLCGYPGCRRSYDYVNKNISAGITIIEGTYIPSKLQQGISTVKVNYDHIDDPDGLSGSPVMLISAGTPMFAGMVLRSTKTSELVHFIDANSILAALNILHFKEISLQFAQ